MNDFLIYLGLGFEHITDPRGYDHILFVIALCAVYTLREWRSVLVLITAFTVGHSITLALATLGVLAYRTDVVELLIPITILITAVSNLFAPHIGHPGGRNRFATRRKRPRPLGRYGLALAFGLIHGLGFSNYLRSLLGQTADIVQPLLAFNIGLELGQLLIVGLVLALTFLALDIVRINRRDWVLGVSGLVIGMAISLIMNNPLVTGK